MQSASRCCDARQDAHSRIVSCCAGHVFTRRQRLDGVRETEFNAGRFEFYFWPSYATNISLAKPCLDHFSELYGQKIPIRIGGTTQDRATYDPNQEAYISYDDPDPLVPPMEVTYGPKFFDLIGMLLLGWPSRVTSRQY